METLIKIDQETITLELANAIAAFNISKVAELLSEKGEFTILKNEEEIDEMLFKAGMKEK